MILMQLSTVSSGEMQGAGRDITSDTLVSAEESLMALRATKGHEDAPEFGNGINEFNRVFRGAAK
jgi:hypothetical protein